MLVQTVAGAHQGSDLACKIVKMGFFSDNLGFSCPVK